MGFSAFCMGLFYICFLKKSSKHYSYKYACSDGIPYTFFLIIYIIYIKSIRQGIPCTNKWKRFKSFITGPRVNNTSAYALYRLRWYKCAFCFCNSSINAWFYRCKMDFMVKKMGYYILGISNSWNFSW